MRITQRPRVLIYKRTHTGDPTPDGVFGFDDCMGSVRTRRFDAVIGVGGTSNEARSCKIARLLTWVGVGPHRRGQPLGHRGPLITFDRFLLLDTEGPELDEIAPALAEYLFKTRPRVVMSDGISEIMLEEVARILKLVESNSKRTESRASKQRRVCLPKPCKKKVC